jgi:hypothetical protein
MQIRRERRLEERACPNCDTNGHQWSLLHLTGHRLRQRLYAGSHIIHRVGYLCRCPLHCVANCFRHHRCCRFTGLNRSLRRACHALRSVAGYIRNRFRRVTCNAGNALGYRANTLSRCVHAFPQPIAGLRNNAPNSSIMPRSIAVCRTCRLAATHILQQ